MDTCVLIPVYFFFFFFLKVKLKSTDLEIERINKENVPPNRNITYILSLIKKTSFKLKFSPFKEITGFIFVGRHIFSIFDLQIGRHCLKTYYTKVKQI